MKVLKNPVVAALLSLAIVVTSTFVSAGVKLGKECNDITDSFYSGVEYDGYTHKSISSQIENISGAVSGMITLARNYDLDTKQLFDANNELKTALSNSEISDINDLYLTVSEYSEELLDELDDVSLNSREENGMDAYRSTIKGAQKLIGEAGYNESIEDFLDDLGALGMFFANTTNTNLPEVFR